MKSSEGLYFEKLDHVRALAAYLVFIWHTIHPLVPYSAVLPGLALLSEGHVGVGLFMVLSGYLFSKITGSRSLNFPAFLWNRAIRLGPLLVFFLFTMWAFFRGTVYQVSFYDLLRGFVTPSWPGGAWSVATEFHFYLLFPLLLLSSRMLGNWTLITAVIAAVALRAALFVHYGYAEDLFYWTIVGRFDQFTLGMLAARLKTTARQRRHACLVIFGSFAVYMEVFNRMGGFYGTAHSALWIIHPTIEGAAFASLILWYDQSRLSLSPAIGKPLAAIGCWSYSIYMLHFFPQLWVFVHFHLGGVQVAPALAIAVATIAFGGMALIGAASYRYIETPLLRFRVPYLGPHGQPDARSSFGSLA